MSERYKIYSELERLSVLSPIPFYWTDSRGVIVGINKHCLDLADNLLSHDLIGKSAYDVYIPESAAIVEEHIKMVMDSGKAMSFEEELTDSVTLQKRVYVSSRSPLFEGDEVIGIVGCITEITLQKDSERLKLENEKQKIVLEEQSKFRQIVDQVVHDIRSPIATMQMVLPSCDILPENIRITLNKSATRIQDIANNLLSKFKQNKEMVDFANANISISLIYDDILEIVTEKKYEYSKLPVNFILDISKTGYFAFINIDTKAFKRMISNLINNAVDACEGKSGNINVLLDLVEDNQVQVIIEDNGKGMSKIIKNKILNNISITSGKTEGHGIGFAQIRSVLANNNIILDIDSKIDQGTKVILKFPKVEVPDWICSSINLYTNDLIVIVDDDPSIHGAWETRFQKISSTIKLKHFEEGLEAIDFINLLSDQQKDNLVLLTDYELLRQGINGLDIVRETQVKRSILVTSHHNNDAVRELAKLTQTKILPKPLASEVAINVLSSEDFAVKHVDLVIVDDDITLVDTLTHYVLKDNKVDTYYDPKKFLNVMLEYAKDTKMLIDYKFKDYEITGFDILQQLHDNGFNRLYLYSGLNFEDNEKPSYVSIIPKSDINIIKKLVS